MTLRPYQQSACAAALSFLRTSVSPCLIDAAPAAGKSHMIAYIADKLHALSEGKRVLCLAPNADLVRQNKAKMDDAGHPSSIFSASAGVKSTRHFIVMATPGTVKNAISRFTKGDYCAVVVDECHGMTPTIRDIVEALREANPNLRVLGLTGTPYVMGGGYIFRAWPDDRTNGDDTCREPYFAKMVYHVSAKEMLEAGYITPMKVGDIHTAAYDTSGVFLLPNGKADDASVERAFVGHGRKTAAIVADVIEESRLRKGGVMLFASTVAHAREIMASLPPENSAMSTGEECMLRGRPAEHGAVIKAYKAQKVRYIVSVGRLTTGFDATWTEVIAVLRYTESATLLTQILGRAWRLHEGKTDCLLLDYAGNVERHFPDGNIYRPTIKAGGTGEKGGPLEVECPDCGYINAFSANPDCADYKLDRHGYCLDTWGVPIETEFGPMAGHFGRRCNGLVKVKREHVRCGYYWTSKECEACGEKNDIAARRCRSCKAEIVDPNERLAGEFKAHKRDPRQPQTDVVLSMEQKESVSRAGNRTVRTDWTTPHRQFSIWFTPDAKYDRARKDWAAFEEATVHGPPETVSYVKDADSNFYRALGYGLAADEVGAA